jgi:hypothetical protein
VTYNTVPWAHDELQGSELNTLRETLNPSKRQRPLPPRPRNHLSDSRRRPLPPTTNRSEIHDIPFLFSSRSSQFANIHAPGMPPMIDERILFLRCMQTRLGTHMPPRMGFPPTLQFGRVIWTRLNGKIRILSLIGIKAWMSFLFL